MSEGTFSHVATLFLSFNLYHTLGLFSRQQFDDISFFIFRRKQDLTFHANCPNWRTFCLKCQIPLSGKNKKNISKCCLLKILRRVLSVNQVYSCFFSVTIFVENYINPKVLIRLCNMARTSLFEYVLSSHPPHPDHKFVRRSQ